MAVTFAQLSDAGSYHPLKMYGMAGDRMVCVPFSVTFDTSYSTGGDAVTWTDYFTGTPDLVLLGDTFKVDGAYFFQYDYTNNKLLAFASDGTEASAGENDLDGVVVRGLAFGRV